VARSSLPLWLVFLLVPLSYGFTPFTAVMNVCPTCLASKQDVVSLTSGQQISCTVLAQNDDYYIITVHGEHRLVTKSEVGAVTWKKSGGPTSLGTGDQILTKNGVVLHGSITEEERGRFFVIQVGSLRHVVWNAQITSVHKGGHAYPLP
jgi:hypothetical protein